MAICKNCGNEFEKGRFPNKIFCSKECREDLYRKNKKYAPCIICGFDKITVSHHLIWRVYGGSNSKNNLISLCPNHHAMIHNEKYRKETEKKIGFDLENQFKDKQNTTFNKGENLQNVKLLS